MTEDKPLYLLNHRKPGMKSGEYSLELRQEIEIHKPEESLEIKPGYKVTISPEAHHQAFSEAHLKLKIEGHQYTLPPELVHSVYPPAGLEGNFSWHLPHIHLNDPSLPWQRKHVTQTPESDTPWLCLLLFSESELVEGEKDNAFQQGVKFREMRMNWEDFTRFWEVDPDTDAQKSMVDVVVLSPEAKRLIPNANDLKYFAHVRTPQPEAGKPLTEGIVSVVCDRLPKPGEKNYVLLVSLEKVLEVGNKEGWAMVCLKKWDFTCTTAGDFSSFMKGLSFAPLHSNSALPEHSPLATLPYFSRIGTQSKAIYHGPLLPGAPANPAISFRQLPGDTNPTARLSDQWVLKDAASGQYDLSYALAFSLGQMNTLGDSVFNKALYQWKVADRQAQRIQEEKAYRLSYMGNAVEDQTNQNSDKNQTESAILQGLQAIQTLTSVPFNYLLPIENMLPEESIRTFYVDPVWIEAMMQGALSPGGTASFPYPKPQLVTGILIRSKIIAGWPNLLLEAFSEHLTESSPVSPLPILRAEQLNSTVKLYLFKGEFREFHAWIPPVGAHFSIEGGRNKGLSQSIHRTIRPQAGKGIGDAIQLGSQLLDPGTRFRWRMDE